MVMEAAMQRQIEGSQETYASMSEEIHRLQESNADLLEALRGAIPFIGYESSGDQEAKERAYAAIAKATGSES